MRYAEHISDKLLMQPKSIRRSTFAQGGILFHNGPDIPGTNFRQSLTITIEEGTALNLSLPSSTELYAIILAAQLLGSKKLHGTIYTDYLEAVTVAHNPSLLRSMSRKANLPLYSFLIGFLALHPGIRLAHVKAHGPSLKMDKWTRQQWGNHHVDKVAKNDNLAFSDTHISWPAQHLEDLIKAHHHWHWVTDDGHLSLEPLRQTLRRHTHLSYMNQRDGFRAKRGASPKWQGAHMGMIEHVWHPNKLSLSKRA